VDDIYDVSFNAIAAYSGRRGKLGVETENRLRHKMTRSRQTKKSYLESITPEIPEDYVISPFLYSALPLSYLHFLLITNSVTYGVAK
jgi:hypothetical protein